MLDHPAFHDLAQLRRRLAITLAAGIAEVLVLTSIVGIVATIAW